MRIRKGNCIICKQEINTRMEDVFVCQDCFYDKNNEFDNWLKQNRPDLIILTKEEQDD